MSSQSSADPTPILGIHHVPPPLETSLRATAEVAEVVS